MRFTESLLLFVPPTVSFGYVVVSALTALVAGAYNLHAARNMAQTVRNSLNTARA
jgi:hypothetical protein